MLDGLPEERLEARLKVYTFNQCRPHITPSATPAARCVKSAPALFSQNATI
jgi:hypothetical protein